MSVRRRISDMTKAVESFRVGRAIPSDLYGAGVPDQTMSLVTDALDKWFALLDGGTYSPVHAAPPVAHARSVILERRELLCVDQQVVLLTFAPTDDGPLEAWTPGMHLDLELKSGRRRQYSLCGDPVENTYTVAVRHVPDGGGGSREMHALEIGDRVTIRGPRNGFPFQVHGRAVFIAGGIGITAILPMVRAARAADMDWRLIYCGRSRASLPFLDEIESWNSPRVTVRTDDVDGIATGPDLLDRSAGGAVFCCGPPPMIECVRHAFDDAAATHLYVERFSPPPVRNGVEFEVQLVSSGRVVTVPADKSVLQSIREVDPDVAYSCQQGFCGTCRVRVLAGTPEHRGVRPTDEREQDEMLICVSRSAGGRIVLDL